MSFSRPRRSPMVKYGVAQLRDPMPAQEPYRFHRCEDSNRVVVQHKQNGPWTFAGEEVKFCPHCGVRLPKSVLEELAEKKGPPP